MDAEAIERGLFMDLEKGVEEMRECRTRGCNLRNKLRETPQLVSYGSHVQGTNIVYMNIREFEEFLADMNNQTHELERKLKNYKEFINKGVNS